MNRLADFLVSFCIALLMHGLLVLGAVWFWTLRPSELRPMFQGGDVSLAVTFVAASPAPERFPPLREAASAGQVGGQAAGDRGQTADGSLSADVSSEVPTLREVGTKEEAPEAKAGRSRPLGESGTDSAAEPPSDALQQGVSGAIRRKSEIRPYYPLGARLRGEEGAVTVRVWVNGSGRARRAEVIRSSGYPALDEAAVDAARRARYVSTRPDAWRAEDETTLTFRFRLTE